MRFTIIRNFSEAIDPEERKLRLHKVAQYAKRHYHHGTGFHPKMAKTLHAIDRSTDPSEKSALRKKYTALSKQVMPHDRRYAVASRIVQKFQLHKKSRKRKVLSKEIRSYQKEFR